MNFETLENFIKKKMKMTHIYQPIMIKTLLTSNNTATVENIARAFVNSDPSQLEYYKKITKRWPHITLKNHNIINYKNGLYTLLVEDITKKQKQKLIELCELRLQEFIDKDPNIKLAHEIDKKSIPGTVRYDVLAKSKGICLACGLKASNGYYLHVDHIIPRSMGGRTELDNLQPLCYKCNTEKRNRDDTDFMKWHKHLNARVKECKLCRPMKLIRENNMAYAINASRLTTLITPKRHVGKFIDLIPSERHLCLELVDFIQSNIRKKNNSIKFEVYFDSNNLLSAKHYSIILHQNK
ncbi:MAG: hydrolase [Cenarchaeum symbiont of Oopsacas minuta]|nr:hydrolase [Cenarchaeum symbiont of Oopsacas minuta]